MLTSTLRRLPTSLLCPVNGARRAHVGGRHQSTLIAQVRPSQAARLTRIETRVLPNLLRTRASAPVLPPNSYLLRPQYAAFHSTPPTQGGPLIPILATLFKASTGFEIARTASRIVLTFFPLLWLGNMKAKKMIKYAAIHGHPASEEKKARLLKKIKMRKRILQTLMLIPIVLFWATIVASLERTPLTGRWRMILLSPEEEDEIAARLAGPGWYRAINGILEEEGSPRVIPTSDWRYRWVHDTLRKLETSIPVLAQEPELCPKETELNCSPMPPPADFPLRPRPRASEYLHWVCRKLSKDEGSTALAGASRAPTSGAPYSLILVDKPDASNAFSYGFGPNGGSGIVVYSGFLDDIFAKIPASASSDQSGPLAHQHQHQPPQTTSIWTKLLGGLFVAGSAPASPTPTGAQTAELAILLAHEMAHLILAHHLESLSSVNVIVPGTLSIASDMLRVLIFPVTMLFGPFVNDAVAQMGKVGSGELLKISEACTSMKQEIEADVVSARLLAHAGFDARDTVRFWEERAGSGIECTVHTGQKAAAEPIVTSSPIAVARQYMGTTHHPEYEVRIKCLKDELLRWETERQKVIVNGPAPPSQRRGFKSDHPATSH